MKILFIDPIFGISGDMMISALIDVGAPFDPITALMKQTGLAIPPLEPQRRQQGMIEGTYLSIGKSDLHLSPGEMAGIIGKLDADAEVRQNALSVLSILVEAEAKVHGVPAADVHFHELSHVDTLLDVLAVAQAMQSLGIEEVYSGPVPFGRGTLQTAHGTIPNPAPATMELLKGYPVRFLDVPLELTTPTGAAIIRHYVKTPAAVPSFSVTRIGYGLGGYVTDVPDCIRLFLGERAAACGDEEAWIIEADLDDMETEYIGAVADRLRRQGALDVLYFPVYMKKGRLGIRLSVTASSVSVQGLADAIFRETSTFGLRLRKDARQTLRREERIVETAHGPLRVKVGLDRTGAVLKTHIEFDDVKAMAEARGIAYREMLSILRRIVEDTLPGD